MHSTPTPPVACHYHGRLSGAQVVLSATQAPQTAEHSALSHLPLGSSIAQAWRQTSQAASTQQELVGSRRAHVHRILRQLPDLAATPAAPASEHAARHECSTTARQHLTSHRHPLFTATTNATTAAAAHGQHARGSQHAARAAAVLQRAYSYPYPRESSSFLFVNGDVWHFETSQWAGVECLADLPVCHVQRGTHTRAGLAASTWGIDLASLSDPTLWTPVLAVGSNASVEQLRRKFFGGDGLIPVVECVLEDFDVVYAPCVSYYGSVTATLQRSPGTRVQVHLMYLQEDQLFSLNASEGRYDLCELQGIQLHVGRTLQQHQELPQAQVQQQEQPLLTAAAAYCYSAGALSLPLRHATGPIALSEVPAQGRRFPHLPQHRMLQLAKAITQAGHTRSVHQQHTRHISGQAARPGLLPEPHYHQQQQGLQDQAPALAPVHIPSRQPFMHMYQGVHDMHWQQHQQPQRQGVHRQHQHQHQQARQDEAGAGLSELDAWVLSMVSDQQARMQANARLAEWGEPVKHEYLRLLQHCAAARRGGAAASRHAGGQGARRRAGAARFICGPAGGVAVSMA